MTRVLEYSRKYVTVFNSESLFFTTFILDTHCRLFDAILTQACSLICPSYRRTLLLIRLFISVTRHVINVIVDKVNTMLIFVSMEGPPMSSFEATAYVKSWLAAGRHAAADMGKTKISWFFYVGCYDVQHPCFYLYSSRRAHKRVAPAGRAQSLYAVRYRAMKE